MRHWPRSVGSVVLSALLIPAMLLAQPEKQKGLESITPEAVRAQLEFLASDWTEGRSTTERGAYMASDYIASIFRLVGLKPYGDTESREDGRLRRRSARPAQSERSYFQTINFVETRPGDSQVLALRSGEGDARQSMTFAYRSDFMVDVSDVGVELAAPVVFVGYGMADEKKGYDDFDGLDVRGKFVLRLTGFPGHSDTSSQAYKKFRADSAAMEWRRDQAKNDLARKHGAIGILEFSAQGDPTKNWADNVPFRVNLPYYEGDPRRMQVREPRLTIPADTMSGGLTRVVITRRVASEVLRGSGITAQSFEQYAREKMKPQSRPLKGKNVLLTTTVQSRIVAGRNVIGVLEGEKADEVIVLGAHYDHVGTREGYIWNGADDNASGTVGIMTIARAFAAAGVKPKKTIVFAAWTGEEKGLLGSEYFVDHPPVPLAAIVMNLNYDMIARDAADDSLGVRCGAFYTQVYGELRDIVERNNAESKLGLELRIRGSDRPSGGSDHASFAAKEIPVLGFMAAMHPDYHLPSDDVAKVNWKKMTAIIRLGYLTTWDIAAKPGKLQASAPAVK